MQELCQLTHPPPEARFPRPFAHGGHADALLGRSLFASLSPIGNALGPCFNGLRPFFLGTLFAKYMGRGNAGANSPPGP